MPRKVRPSLQNAVGSVSVASNKISAAVGAEALNGIHTDFVGTDGHGLAKVEVSAGFNAPMVSQPLPPIGTPALKTDTPADMRSQTIK